MRDPSDGRPRGRGGVLRNLLAISRDFEPRLLRALHERGHRGLRPSFARFLYLVWDEPRPLNTIADELGISRQAASHTARLVEEAGYVERRPNPADGRSKLVVITPQGRAVDDAQGRAALRECEAYYEALVGRDELARLVDALVALREGLGVAPNPASARTSIGVLPLVALQARDDVIAGLLRRGHADLKPSHHDLLARIGRDGARASDLARAQGVTRQATGSTLQEMEALGYLARRPDEHDLRGVVFTPTELGLRLLDHHVAALDEVEGRFGALLGAPRLGELEASAHKLALALQVEAALVDGDGPVAVPAAPPPHLELLAERLHDVLGSADAARLGTLLAGHGTA